MLNVLIVDDEPLAHEVVLHHCRGHADLNVIGQCYNAAEALAALERLPVDLMFLDIRMPRFGGLELLRGLAVPPHTVIVSAHREHALDGFDLDVVDYLMKPVSAERFASAVEKVRRRLAKRATNENRDLVLKVDRAMRRFRLGDICFFEAEGNFVKVWSDEGAFLATVTMRHLLEKLPIDDFIQIHKSFIVNRARIVESRASSVRLDNGMEMPIGKTFRRQVHLFSGDGNGSITEAARPQKGHTGTGMFGGSFNRIVVADDHPMIREVLEASLKRAYPKASIESAQTLDEAIAFANDGDAVDLFVLDLLFPGMEGEESLRLLRQNYPTASIVIVTMLEDPIVAAKMIDAGADGYLGKGLSSDEMANGIERIREGEFVINISPNATNATSTFRSEPPVLTPRQAEIMQLMAQRMPNKNIARELGISHHTVRNHVTIMLRSLGVETRSQLVRRAYELDIITQANSNGGER